MVDAAFYYWLTPIYYIYRILSEALKYPESKHKNNIFDNNNICNRIIQMQIIMGSRCSTK